MSVLEALKNNGFETIDYAVFVVYIIILVGLGVFLSRGKKGEEKSSADYFLAGNTLTWWAVGASLIAANISAEQFIGMSGSAFNSGIAMAAYELMAAATLLVVGKFLLPWVFLSPSSGCSFMYSLTLRQWHGLELLPSSRFLAFPL